MSAMKDIYWVQCQHRKLFIFVKYKIKFITFPNGEALESFVWIWPSRRNFPEFQMGLGFWCSEWSVQRTASQMSFQQWVETLPNLPSRMKSKFSQTRFSSLVFLIGFPIIFKLSPNMLYLGPMYPKNWGRIDTSWKMSVFLHP